jgi:ectoine hydroxylase-related dioxygenase (phytanoyl-CoA dioxygenase family)
MTQPAPGKNAPEEVVHVLTGVCQTMPSALRLCGHPQLLTIAEAINGDDFVPYTEVAFVKQPGLGGSVAWHQDGATHWESQNWDEGIHGFNFQAQLYACTERNCLWVVPGTHKGRVDIAALVASNAGSELIPGAVPMVCEPGDVTIANRQILHGSFANTSPTCGCQLRSGLTVVPQCWAHRVPCFERQTRFTMRNVWINAPA